MKLPKWMRKPTNTELIEMQRTELADVIDAEMMALQRSIYTTEKTIHMEQSNLKFQKQRLEFLRMQRGPRDEAPRVRAAVIKREPIRETA